MDLLAKDFSIKLVSNDNSFLVVLEEKIFINHKFNRKYRLDIETSIIQFLLLKNTGTDIISSLSFFNKYLKFNLENREFQLDYFSTIKIDFFKEFGVEWFLTLNPKWYKVKEDKDINLTKSELEKGLNLLLYSLLRKETPISNFVSGKEYNFVQDDILFLYSSLNIDYFYSGLYGSLRDNQLVRKIKEHKKNLIIAFKNLPDNYFLDKLNDPEKTNRYNKLVNIINVQNLVQENFFIFKTTKFIISSLLIVNLYFFLRTIFYYSLYNIICFI